MPDMRATPIVYQGQQPASAPFPKVVYGGMVSAFGNNIYGIRRVSYVAQAATTDQVIISPNGTCSNGLATPQSFVLAFGTQQAVDSYGLNILGGPAEPEPGNIFTQAVGTSSTRVVLGFKTTKGKGGRKLPWISGIQQGDGVTEDLYGTYDYITPDGVVHTAPGPKDKIVNTPRVRVKLAMSGMTDISYLKFTGDPDTIYQNKGLAADIDKIRAAIGAGSGGTAYKSGFGIEINGVTPPTGVALELATGTDLGIGLYDYVFTKRTSTHKESGPSAVFAITTTTGNQDVTVTLPALDPVNDPLTIGYSIYRSAVGGTGTPISQCSGVTSTVDGTGKTTYQYQIPSSYLLSYDPSVLAVDGAPPLPIDPATGLATTFDSGTGLFMSGMSVFDATLPQTYTSGQGYTFVADHGAGAYTDTASDASIAANKRPPGDNTPEIDTLLATVDETLHSPLKSGLINTGPSGGLLPLGRGLKINPAVVGGVDVSGILINAGDDANGVQVVGACPEILPCAPTGGRYSATLNMGPGDWLGGTGSYNQGFGVTTTGYIAMDLPAYAGTEETYNLLDMRRADVDTFVYNNVDLFNLNATVGSGDHASSFLTMVGSGLIAYQDFQFQADPNIPGTHDLTPYVAPRMQIEGDVLFNLATHGGPGSGGVFFCNTDATFFGAVQFLGTTQADAFLAAGLITAEHGFTSIPTSTSIDGIDVNLPVLSTANIINGKTNGSPVFTVAADGTTTIAGAVTAPSAHFTGTATITNDGRTDHKAISVPATPASGYTSLYSKTVSGTTKLYYKDDAGTEHDLASGSGGTVTSVGLSAPSSILTVASSPVTGSGTIALTLATQTANTVFSGPTTGSPAAPTFRGLVAADIPDLSATYALAGTTGGAGELLVEDGVTSPPVALYSEDGSDFLFAG